MAQTLHRRRGLSTRGQTSPSFPRADLLHPPSGRLPPPCPSFPQTADCLHLWAHRPRGEGVTPKFASGRRTDGAGAARPVAELDSWNVRQDQQSVCLEVLGKERRSQILVDHRLRSHETSIVAPCHRDAAPASTDHHRTSSHERTDLVTPQHSLRLGARHDSSPGRSVPTDLPTPATRQRLSVVLRVDRSDKFRGRFECRIVRRDQGLGGQADHRTGPGGRSPRPAEASSRSCLESGRPGRREDRDETDRGRAALSSARRPDLGPIAVRDDQVVVLGQRRECVDGGPHMVLLDLGVGRLAPLEEGIATECSDNEHVSRPAWRP